MNSFVTNLYMKPTPGATSQRLLPTASTVASFSAVNSATKSVSFDIQSEDVFMTIDGSTPTSTNGHKLYAGRAYTISSGSAKVAKFISASGTAAIFGSELTT
jgi:hypothetical protein